MCIRDSGMALLSTASAAMAADSKFGEGIFGGGDKLGTNTNPFPPAVDIEEGDFLL